MKRTLKLSILAIAGFAVFSSYADDVSVTIVDPTTHSFTAHIGGLLQLDQTSYFNDIAYGPTFEDGLEVRRARLKVYGNVSENLSYYAELSNYVPTRGTMVVPTGVNGLPAPATRFSLSGVSTGANVLGANTIYVAYSYGHGAISIGNQFPNFGYEASRAARSQVFLEDSMPAQFFGTINNLGVNVTGNTNNVTYGLSVYLLPRIFNVISSPTIPAAGTSTAQFNNIGGSGRITISPSNKNMHIGGSGLYEFYNNEFANYKTYGLSTNFGLKGLQTQFFIFQPITQIDSGDFYKVNSMYQLSIEAALVNGCVSGFGEGYYATVNSAPTLAGASTSDSFYGFNSEISFMLTGEVKSYDRNQARIIGVTPNSSKGAWEIGIRGTYLNLLSANVAAGRDLDTLNFTLTTSSWTANNGTAGGLTSAQFSSYSLAGLVAWHANANVSVRGNVVYTQLPTITGVSGSPALANKPSTILGVGLRAQIAW